MCSAAFLCITPYRKRKTNMKSKKISILLITLAFGILSLPFSASAVVDWTKDDANNPVLLPGGSGAWDEKWIQRPMIIKDGSPYKMWYTGGWPEETGTTAYIGYATSGDGITNWQKYNSGISPVLSPSPSGWDSANVAFCWVIKMESGDTPYKMWYSGNDNSGGPNNMQIGYATSTDGIIWIKGHSGVTDPVLEYGSGVSDWDANGVGVPTVIYDESATTPYKMWYIGFNETPETAGIGYAESQDGINWVKYDDPDTDGASGDTPYANSDPVITAGPVGAWDHSWPCSPCVIKEDSIYRMWYNAYPKDDDHDRIGYAYSLDGIHWRRYDGNPVIMQGGLSAFDEYGAMDPMVLKDGNTTYKMWYMGSGNCGGPNCAKIGYATSSAYEGSPPAINYAGVATLNRSLAQGGMHIMMYFIPEGPGPLDINELKLDGPGGSGFSYNFFDWDLTNWMGTQFIALSTPKDPVDSGTYTYTMKSNNGQTATKALSLTATTIPVPQDGSGAGQLDRAVNGNTADYVYTGNSTPNFRWKPMTGYTSGYYYRVRVIDWKYNNSWWYVSDPQEGTNTDGSGYMYAQAASGILKANAPYHWSVEVMDTNNTWSASNRAWSDWRHIYTGTKSGTADFLSDDWGKAGLVSERSFRTGDRAFFYAFVHNLAPWDIELDSPNQFRVDDPSDIPFHYFNLVNDAFYTDPFPFMYSAGEQGLPGSGDYDFYVYEDGTSDYESHTLTLARNDSVPRVTKDEMRHENAVTRVDNAYLPYADPELFWKSKGSGYWHRVMIFDWHYRRFVWQSGYMTGIATGSDMSAQVPKGTLKPNNPYRWWVEVYDDNGYGTGPGRNRTRSQWLSFMTGPAQQPGRFLTPIYLLLLLGD
jgi:hypothetical protein